MTRAALQPDEIAAFRRRAAPLTLTPPSRTVACPQCGALGAPLVSGHEFGISALEIESDT